jgi:hypothetical protein
LVDLDEPSGAACIVGGVSPCGLDGGAPPLPVVIGPVEPCGWPAPLVVGDFIGSLPEFCALAIPIVSKPSATPDNIRDFAIFPNIIMCRSLQNEG